MILPLQDNTFYMHLNTPLLFSQLGQPHAVIDCQQNQQSDVQMLGSLEKRKVQKMKVLLIFLVWQILIVQMIFQFLFVMIFFCFIFFLFFLLNETGFVKSNVLKRCSFLFIFISLFSMRVGCVEGVGMSTDVDAFIFFFNN